MSESRRVKRHSQLHIDGWAQSDAKIQAYRDRNLDVDPAALELQDRMALTETARYDALVRRFSKYGMVMCVADCEA
jgi:hypothetical protein